MAEPQTDKPKSSKAAFPSPKLLQLSPAQMRKSMRYARDPIRFVMHCCKTQDEAVAQVDPSKAVRPFPEKAFIRTYIEHWQRYRLLAIPKSRRMLATWTLVCLDLWLAMYTRYSKVFIISSDQTNSEKLLDRIRHVYENLPPDCHRPKINIRKGVSGKPAVIEFPEIHSSIEAISSDPDKIRQEGVTLLHVEEFSVWQWPEASWAAMLPTLMGGGRIVVVATPQAGSLFRDLVYDEMGEIATGQESVTQPISLPEADKDLPASFATGRPLLQQLGQFKLPPQAEMVGQGVASWTNRYNKFRILAVHYTADPDKRTTEWRAEAEQGYTEKLWRQEYELDFSTFAGQAVYSSFGEMHVAPRPLAWVHNSQYAMIRAWDIGTHACVWLQVIRGEMRVYKVRQRSGAFPGNTGQKYQEQEINVSGLSLFIAECLRLSDVWFKPQNTMSFVVWEDIVDPATFSRTITGEESTDKIFRNFKLKPRPGLTQNTFVRVSAVEDWLGSMWQGKPAFQIDPTATLLIDGMTGGYVYDTSGKKPGKGPFSHTANALEYACTVYPAPQASQLLREERQKREQEERIANDGTGYAPQYDNDMGSMMPNDEDWAQY